MIDVNQIIDGILRAEFENETWAIAMKVLRLQVNLGLKQAEVSNLQSAHSTDNESYNEKLDYLQSEEAAIRAEIQKLAPSN